MVDNLISAKSNITFGSHFAVRRKIAKGKLPVLGYKRNRKME